ncbi:hypothetical protein QTH90_29800 [Variovorax sp. J2P1-59]|uniref:glycosyltransferase family 2 protein n=1 Tax=Variovorax flavidus TaxID=3053501 RepID=UPI00257849E3|nr:glycosyltransferase [Variovorax sp. J2P1-59]MDM0078634.1 hypothetical protein [Variovorax sp. J2P1-59]
MQISILIPAYARPEQLGEALESIFVQDRSLIGEIIVGDDSPSIFWPRNQAVIVASGLSDLIDYVPSDPPKGTYPNQWFLASRAKFDHLLFLHNDDLLRPGALRVLADARANESDPRVKLWFGRQQVIDESGAVDPRKSVVNDLWYGRQGPACARPVWEWCLTESIPSDAFLVERATYLQLMQGERDGNVGDWAFSVRLANSGNWARFVAQTVSRYRVQSGSVTSGGRGVDAHRAFEFARELRIPPEFEEARAKRFYPHMLVVASRYVRDGERMNGWRAFLSPHIPWWQRFTPRSARVLVMLSTPRSLWRWALRYKD